MSAPKIRRSSQSLRVPIASSSAAGCAGPSGRPMVSVVRNTSTASWAERRRMRGCLTPSPRWGDGEHSPRPRCRRAAQGAVAAGQGRVHHLPGRGRGAVGQGAAADGPPRHRPRHGGRRRRRWRTARGSHPARRVALRPSEVPAAHRGRREPTGVVRCSTRARTWPPWSASPTTRPRWRSLYTSLLVQGTRAMLRAADSAHGRSRAVPAGVLRRVRGAHRPAPAGRGGRHRHRRRPHPRRGAAPGAAEPGGRGGGRASAAAFPRLRSMRVTASDPVGYAAGHAAADRARLGGQEVRGRVRRLRR